MKCNVGKMDKTIRILFGLGLVLWGYSEQNWLGLIGLIPLLTGLLGWCPAYLPFGFSSKKD